MSGFEIIKTISAPNGRLIKDLQIWRLSEGKLFRKLQMLAQGFMEDIAVLCDSRFAELRCEYRGEELATLQSANGHPVEPSDPGFQLQADSDGRKVAPLRQDDLQVCAVRLEYISTQIGSVAVFHRLVD